MQAYASKVATETRASKVNAEAVKQPRKITEEELKLEPLCNEVHKNLELSVPVLPA